MVEDNQDRIAQDAQPPEVVLDAFILWSPIRSSHTNVNIESESTPTSANTKL